MREEFLHHIWKYKKFDFSNLTTVCRKKITILESGTYQDVGADFFNARIVIDNLQWAGNVEIHLKSSDWYLHNHQNDPNYDNVILHVVWNHDVDVYRKDRSEIPVLELSHYVPHQVNENYMNLLQHKSWIFCEHQLPQVSPKLIHHWKEQLFVERLQQKSVLIHQLLSENQNDWEAALFCMLAKNFGLNTNGEAFLQIAQSIPFHIIRKESYEVENLEALFFGRAGLLNATFEDYYPNELKQRWDYLKTKYRLEEVSCRSVEFFRHRPDNFPTIRLAQLAMLYHKNQYFFDTVVNALDLNTLYQAFQTEVSPYWKSHYTFDKSGIDKRKPLTKSFVDLLIINTVAPFRYSYGLYLNKPQVPFIQNLLRTIKPEQNAIIERFLQLGITVENALDSQSLLQLKNQYCNYKRCLDCKIGISLLQ